MHFKSVEILLTTAVYFIKCLGVFIIWKANKGYMACAYVLLDKLKNLQMVFSHHPAEVSP